MANLLVSMGELNVIRDTVRQAATRRRLEHALHGLWLGLLLGASLWLLVLAIFKVAPLPPALVGWAWIAPIAAGLLGALLGGWKRVPPAAAARLVETRHRLDQRLSTALELASRPAPAGSPEPTDSPWTRLVIADAAEAVRGIEIRRLIPLHLPAFARWIPLVVAVVVGLGFVPEYRSADYLKKKKEAQVVRETGRKVAEVLRQELKERTPFQEAIRESLTEAANLGDRLSQAKLSKAESLSQLANAADRLKEEARQLDSQPVLQKLQQAARTPSSASSPGGSNPALQKQLEKIQRSLGTSPDALEKLAEQLQQAQKLAAGMQGSSPEGAAQQALSQALSQLAQNAAQMGLDAGALNKALEAMKDLNIDRILKNLASAGQDLEKLRDMAKKMAEAQKMAEQAGKDLAEQLERGQANAAAETLDKMVEQLKGAGLTPEQMQKLLAEVAKALKPAGEYGKVGEMLKAASEQMKSDQKGEASKNLAQAAAELRQMAQQAMDAQQLAEALEALQGAQIAIASGMSWQPGGQCKGGACTGCALHPKGRPRVGKGGKPGRGVGTWADENGWLYYPEITERWDNSGLVRPDMAGRGHTDRGDGKLTDTILPTKLSGQFSPGPMPSIPLKGVSIVGKSSVQYEQAVDTAQSEAQSALNQDQVPRAYRGAVKGYFDDLK